MPRKVKGNLLRTADKKIDIVDGARVFVQLKQEAIKRGIFDRSYHYYAVIACISFLGVFVSAYGIYRVTNPLLIVFWGISFAFFSVQIAGILHDAGHRSIFQSSKNNDILGSICGIFTVQAYNFWKIKHNKHHAHTNQEGEDPDVELPLLSFTQERALSKKGLAKMLLRYQSYIYFPMGILVVFSPRIGSIKYFLNAFSKKMWWEILLFGTGFFIIFLLPFVIFDLQKALLLFATVNITAGFYLINVFAPNHKGMPQIDEDGKFSFLEQQIITSRNITGHWLTDFLYMGLNYQIEHHLFPHTPRNKLHLLTPLVKDLSKKMKLEYTQVSYLESTRMILSELNQYALLATNK
ncbi:MAG: acyl-CoA desaturase [Candidatus Levybacteria bacterium]|nr:acyl-CoA desaturase [Candidatus Levybacteria bacterium]